jgi:hypothetical protein
VPQCESFSDRWPQLTSDCVDAPDGVGDAAVRVLDGAVVTEVVVERQHVLRLDSRIRRMLSGSEFHHAHVLYPVGGHFRLAA